MSIMFSSMEGILLENREDREIDLQGTVSLDLPPRINTILIGSDHVKVKRESLDTFDIHDDFISKRMTSLL
jgi:hypothetical protein